MKRYYSEFYISKLQRVQNTAARIVTITARHNHITPVLKKLHWLPVKYRAQFKLLVHTHKALHDRSPVYLRDMLQMYTPGRISEYTTIGST